MIMSRVPAPAPYTHSPMAAAVASLSTTTGTSNLPRRRSRRGTSVSGRLTDSTMRPAAKSTMEATPTPMPSTRPEPCSRSAMQASMPRTRGLGRAHVGEHGEPVHDLRRLHLAGRARVRTGQAPAHQRGGHFGAADVDSDDEAFRGHGAPELTMV